MKALLRAVAPALPLTGVPAFAALYEASFLKDALEGDNSETTLGTIARTAAPVAAYDRGPHRRSRT